MIVTLRRAGAFDPVQFFRGVLIRINSISANLAQSDQYWADDGEKPSIMRALSRRRATKRNVSMRVEICSSATIVAKMSLPREF
jgi:hypothetical protein